MTVYVRRFVKTPYGKNSLSGIGPLLHVDPGNIPLQESGEGNCPKVICWTWATKRDSHRQKFRYDSGDPKVTETW